MSKLQLPDVTLFGIDASNAAGIMRAADICKEGIDFGNVVIITERLFPGSTREEGRIHYSEFMIKKLTKYFTTSHVLTIHSDGFIQNAAAWDPEWLDTDMLGAPWEWYSERQVGNGGFSLRSKKICDILAKDDHISEYMPEDDMICRKYHDYLVDKYGIKFGSIEQARKFSIEGWATPIENRVYGGEFGFHGFLIRDLPIPPRR